MKDQISHLHKTKVKSMETQEILNRMVISNPGI